MKELWKKIAACCDAHPLKTWDANKETKSLISLNLAYLFGFDELYYAANTDKERQEVYLCASQHVDRIIEMFEIADLMLKIKVNMN